MQMVDLVAPLNPAPVAVLMVGRGVGIALFSSDPGLCKVKIH